MPMVASVSALTQLLDGRQAVFPYREAGRSTLYTWLYQRLPVDESSGV